MKYRIKDPSTTSKSGGSASSRSNLKHHALTQAVKVEDGTDQPNSAAARPSAAPLARVTGRMAAGTERGKSSGKTPGSETIRTS